METKEMQQLWDDNLIDCWLNNKHYITGRLAASLFGISYYYDEDYLKLKRVPNHAWESGCDIFSFVGQYLPMLQNWLLATKKTDLKRIEKIRFSMKKLSVTQPRNKTEHMDKANRSEKLMEAQIQSRKMVMAQRENSSRTNWAKVS